MYEKTTDSKILHKGYFLDFVEHDVELDTEPVIKSKRQFFIHPGGVCVVPILDGNKIVLVKQYRKAIEQILIEIPAGKIDAGETDTIVTAKRELQEETGYSADTWINLGQIQPCPGYCSEILYLYLAKNLHAGEQNLDHGEIVEKLIIDLDEAKAMIHRGEIRDAKTICGIFLAENYLQ